MLSLKGAARIERLPKARGPISYLPLTHSPNLAIVCDADQLITCKMDKGAGNLITYESGAIESPPTNARGVDVLEGTFPAFDNRRLKWMKPQRLPN